MAVVQQKRRLRLLDWIDTESGVTCQAIDKDFAFELISIHCDMFGYSMPLYSNINLKSALKKK